MKRIITLTLLCLIGYFSSSLATGVISCTNPYGLGTCNGTATVVSCDSAGAGTWSASPAGIVTISGSVVTGSMPGTCTIMFTPTTGSPITATFTVTDVAGPILGNTGPICYLTGSLALSDATLGGAWASSGSALTVDAVGNVSAGASGGTQEVDYVVGPGCYVSTAVVVNAPSVGPDTSVYGPSAVCVGGDITISSAASGGTWSLGTGTGTVILTPSGSSCGVHGSAAGDMLVIYTVAGTCGSASISKTISVAGTTDPGVISGSSTVHTGGVTNLTESIGGGSWSTTSTNVTVDAASGQVSASLAGPATIMYTVSGCSGPASTTFPITVADIDGVSGYVNFTFEPYYGPVKVRLITQSTSGTTGNTVLTEYASTSGECNGTSYYYEFIGVPTNTYLIKAANNDSMASDYLPTYAPSEAFWNAPFTTQLVHTSGTADINQNITMLHGAVTSGPGFISGDVVVDHANKGTSGTIPAIGLHIILKNNSSSSILKFIDTDPSGHYSFSGLPYGTYSIFPDSMSYISTAYTTITLSAAHPSDATAGFTQHTVSQTITPSAATAVSNIAAVTYGVSAFPNPSNGRVIIQWNEKATENGTVIVTDITGREVYKSTINMIQGNGSTPIDLTAVSNGLYTISITSASLTYKDKLEIAR